MKNSILKTKINSKIDYSLRSMFINDIVFYDFILFFPVILIQITL